MNRRTTSIIILLLIGFLSSLYLAKLYHQVRWIGAEQVDSICAINETINCITIAQSRFATFWGIPVAWYGMAHYLFALIVLLLHQRSHPRFSHAPELVGLISFLSLPAMGSLAWVSATKIGAACPFCYLVYIVQLVVTMIVLITDRQQLFSRLMGGLGEMFRGVRDVAIWRVIVVSWMVTMLLAKWGAHQLYAQSTSTKAQTQTSRTTDDSDGARSAEGSILEPYGIPYRGLSLGVKTAPIVLEVFSDFECPACFRNHETLLELITKHPTLFQIEHHDFPIDQTCNPYVKRRSHQDSCRAALSARCAAKQEKFWQYEQMLYANREKLDARSLRDYAKSVGLTLKDYDRCIKDPRIEIEVKNDIDEGKRRDIRSTPTVFVNGEQVSGPKPIDFYEAKIQDYEPAGH